MVLNPITNCPLVGPYGSREIPDTRIRESRGEIVQGVVAHPQVHRVNAGVAATIVHVGKSVQETAGGGTKPSILERVELVSAFSGTQSRGKFPVQELINRAAGFEYIDRVSHLL
jgi:hypothetical protein